MRGGDRGCPCFRLTASPFSSAASLRSPTWTSTSRPARITGLIGPNGAGKTTMFNVICGLQPATHGRVTFDGKDASGYKPHERARLGIARTFQRLEVFGSLSRAREHPRRRRDPLALVRRGRRSARQVTEEILDRDRAPPGGRSPDRHDADRARSPGRARPRARHARPKLLLLDEPSSGLGDEETVFFARIAPGSDARRARHTDGRTRCGARYGYMRADPRAGLRPEDRGRDPGGDPGE